MVLLQCEVVLLRSNRHTLYLQVKIHAYFFLRPWCRSQISFPICPLPSPSSVLACMTVRVHMCTFIYVWLHGVCVCVEAGGVTGTGEFNHALTDVCSIDLLLFCEHCSRPFRRDINLSIKPLDFPAGFTPHEHTASHPSAACAFVFYLLFGEGFKGGAGVLAQPLPMSEGGCIDLSWWKCLILWKKSNLYQ